MTRTFGPIARQVGAGVVRENILPGCKVAGNIGLTVGVPLQTSEEH